MVGFTVDPYTSKSGEVMRARTIQTEQRKEALRAAHQVRLALIAKTYFSNEKIVAALSRAVSPRDSEFQPNDSGITATGITSSGITACSLTTTMKKLNALKTAPAFKKGGPAAKRAGAKAIKRMERSENAEFLLDRTEATLYRALAARANFLSQDRPDINFATKELCREFSAPNQKSYLRLKRLVRYLVGLPRLVYRYDFIAKGQQPASTIDLYVDTDFAGCRETRRSTSGGVATVGGTNIKHWSKTQPTIALSSGEAELNGIGAGIAQGLGVRSICNDLGYNYSLRIHSDATAAIGIARRRGMGKIRHLDTTDLWVQEVVRSGRVELMKVLGTENPADVLTKYVEKPLLVKMLAKMGMMQMEGRAACAPSIAKSVSSPDHQLTSSEVLAGRTQGQHAKP